MSKDQTTTAVATPWQPAQGSLETSLSLLDSMAFGGQPDSAPSRRGPAISTGFGGRPIMARRGGVSRSGGSLENGTLMVNPYEGDRVADMSPETLAAIQAMTEGSGIAAPSQAALIDMIQGDDGIYRDFDLIRERVTDDTLSSLHSVFSGGDINNSLVRDNYVDTMTSALAGVEYGAYGDAQNRRLSALGLAPSIAGIDSMEEAAAFEAGTALDAQAQRELSADVASYYEEENKDLQALKEYANLAMGIGGMGGTSSSTQPVSMLPGIGKLAGGIGAGLEGLAAAGILSDRRVKEDIRRVGTTDGGLPVYTYRYKGSDTYYMGVMAQEVGPEAVVDMGNGLLGVDYSKVT